MRWLTFDGDVSWSEARFTEPNPAGPYVPEAVGTVASAGATVDNLHRLFGSLRWRYFGPRALTEDNSQRSQATSLFELAAGYQLTKKLRVTAELFNLFNSAVSDIPPARAPARERWGARRVDAGRRGGRRGVDRGPCRPLRQAADDLELAVARAGCALLDRREGRRRRCQRRQVESLKRWCAARLHDRAYRDWVIFRFPETLDYWRLVDVQRPRPELPEWMVGPDDRLRRRDGFKLTDARMTPREVLSEIHYCVLCHERDKDSCSKGLRDRSRRAGEGRRQPARHRARRLSARREDFRDAHAAEGGRRDRRARARHRSTTRCARAPAIASATTA